MTPPDLKDPVQRAAYRRELQGVARGMRRGGIAMALIGALLLLLRRTGFDAVPMWLAGSVVGLGLMLMISAISARVTYHSRRMRD